MAWGVEVRPPAHVQRSCPLCHGPAYLADTYNNRIKTLNPHTREVKSFCPGQRPSQAVQDGVLHESAVSMKPAGLARSQWENLCADTNNHASRVIDIAEVTLSKPHRHVEQLIK